MGYTHYWRSQKRFTDNEWNTLREKVKKVLDAYGELVTPPLVDSEVIRFNGIGDDGHETFLLTKQFQDFEFCKTRQKPYDLVVCLVLLAVDEFTPGVLHISSDGVPEDWQCSLDEFNKLFNKKDMPSWIES